MWLCKWEPLSHHCVKFDKVFSLSRDITWPYDQMDMWLGKLEPLTLCQDPTKSDTSRSCESGDKTFLSRHVGSRDHVIKGTREMGLGKREPLNLSHHTAKFGGCTSCASGDIMF